MSLPQPVPPSWKDLGKSSNDLLSKDYPFSSYSLEVKTKAPSDVAFKVAGSRSSSSPTAPIHGDLEAKWSDKKHGLVFTQTWTSANVLKTQFELDNQIAKGLKLDILGTLAPEKEKGKRETAIVNAIYKQSGFHTRAAIDLFKGPTFTLDSVVGRDGMLIGAEAAFDVMEGKISRYAAAVGYNAPEYAVTLHALQNLNHVSASYYHRVNADVEAGAKAIYDPKATPGGMALEVGTKVYLDASAFVKAKINNAGVIALGYTQSLRPGVKMGLGLALDTQKLNDATAITGHPSHKFGASFVFEA